MTNIKVICKNKNVPAPVKAKCILAFAIAVVYAVLICGIHYATLPFHLVYEWTEK